MCPEPTVSKHFQNRILFRGKGGDSCGFPFPNVGSHTRTIMIKTLECDHGDIQVASTVTALLRDEQSRIFCNQVILVHST